jgi:hypothetical protein
MIFKGQGFARLIIVSINIARKIKINQALYGLTSPSTNDARLPDGLWNSLPDSASS